METLERPVYDAYAKLMFCGYLPFLTNWPWKGWRNVTVSPLCHLHGLNGQSCCAFVIDNLTKGRLVFFMNSSEFGFKHAMNQATVNLKMSSKGQSYFQITLEIFFYFYSY